MNKIKAAIVGYGNIGHFVLEALQEAPDFEIEWYDATYPTFRQNLHLTRLQLTSKTLAKWMWQYSALRHAKLKNMLKFTLHKV